MFSLTSNNSVIHSYKCYITFIVYYIGHNIVNFVFIGFYIILRQCEYINWKQLRKFVREEEANSRGIFQGIIWTFVVWNRRMYNKS